MASASPAAASSSIVELDEAADLVDTATSAYFDDGDSAFSWPVAERITSTMTCSGQLRSLCNEKKVPKEYKTFFAHSNAACTAPSEGSNAICVYADAFDAGMRLPLHDFHAAVLRHYGLAPSQPAPYAWRYMAAFVLLCTDAGVEPQVPVFRHFFSIFTNKGDARGWHHFKPYQQRRLFKGNMARCNGWKSKFFFLQSPPEMPWPCPTKWGKPSRAAVRRPAVTTDAMRTAIEKLLERAGNTGIDVLPFLSRRTLPVGRHQTPLMPLQLTPMKVEAAAAASVAGTDQTRKRKSPESVTPPPPPPPQGSIISAGEGSTSATRGLSQLARMAEAELDRKEQELQAGRTEVARLSDELRSAKDAHNAEVFNLKEELQTANAAHAAEVSQLEEELEQAKAKHAADIARLDEERAAEVQAVKVQCQREIISLQHKSVIDQSERYIMGLKDMRQLAVATYPDVVKPSELQHQLLSRYPDQQGVHPQEPLNE